MSTEFDRPLYGYRFAETQFGDSLQTIAARELGDAARWVDLVAFNNLVPPFITDDAATATAGVLLSGSLILVPAPAPVASDSTDPDKVFLTDIGLSAAGELTIDTGDFAPISGRQNLVQALTNRIMVERGDLMYHTEYGCNIRRIIGALNGPTASLLSAQYAKSAVEADSRIDRVTKAEATVVGDTVNVTIEAVTIAGRSIALTASP